MKCAVIGLMLVGGGGRVCVGLKAYVDLPSREDLGDHLALDEVGYLRVAYRLIVLPLLFRHFCLVHHCKGPHSGSIFASIDDVGKLAIQLVQES